MLSIAYSDFRAGFREVRTSEGFLSIADLGRRPAKPNKANLPKAFVINNMTEKSAKQTQLAYHTCYQLLTAILTAFFKKFGWMGRGSLSVIRAHGRPLRSTTLTLRKRAKGPDVWQFRWMENGKPKSVLIGTVERYPAQADAERAVEGLRMKINAPNPQEQFRAVTVAALIDRFMGEYA